MDTAILVILAVVAAIAVLRPLLRPAAAGSVDFDGAPASEKAKSAARAAIEVEIERYREAIRAGTVCDRCGQANPADSRFCFECGRPLAATASTTPAP